MSGTQDSRSEDAQKKERKDLCCWFWWRMCLKSSSDALFETVGQRGFLKFCIQTAKSALPYPSPVSQAVQDLVTSSGRKLQSITYWGKLRGGLFTWIHTIFFRMKKICSTIRQIYVSNITHVRNSCCFCEREDFYSLCFLRHYLTHAAERRLMWVCTPAHL